MLSRTGNYLSTKAEIKQLGLLALPIMFSRFSFVAIGFIGIVMAGQISTVDLAAVATGSNIFGFLVHISTGVLSALTPQLAFFFGKKQYDRMAIKMTQALWVALALGLVMAFCFQNIEPLLQWYEVSPELKNRISQYLYIISWGMPAMMLVQLLISFFNSIGQPKPVMFIVLIAMLLNIPVNALFIYGWFGLEPLGGIGCGWGVTFTAVFMLMALFVYYLKQYAHFRLFRFYLAVRINQLKQFLKLGLPISGQIFAELSIMTAISLSIAHLDPTLIAAHQIAINVSEFLLTVLFGISIAITIRTGQTLGQKEPQLAARRSWFAVKLAALIGFVFMAVVLLFSQKIPMLYSNDAAILEVASPLMFFVAILHFFAALKVGVVGALKGYHDTALTVLIYIIGYFCLVFPLGSYFSTFKGQAVQGFWYALILGTALIALLVSLRLRYITENKSFFRKQFKNAGEKKDSVASSI
ncbi:MATE family efflux transporter [Spartinivicinus poritis]|uniref:Multidrug-efflux transporter n=1 Tax=Spartinivicinus poritis TaxID=2994640 RepID=A0ABT5U880_9GAMM|nr:MATE family efflux transporter [Spartinivicinus sp. A2-2]MDE1462575.1 MATE family efflux transporter [Spartinivicinus sp. A2-2]